MSKVTGGTMVRRARCCPDPAIIRGMIASILRIDRPGRRSSRHPARLVFVFVRPSHEGLRRGCGLKQPSLGLLMKAGRSRTLFVNADGPGAQSRRAGRWGGRVVSIGLINEADYMAFNVGGTGRTWEFFVDLHGRDETFLINFTGDRQVYNALFAIAVADQLGFTPGQIRQGLRRFRPPRSCCF
ncbi:MAG TPA: hypothetical protein DCY27_01170 [Desulfobacterales bacterium]|nr:hypothetical protein [Desulfobacterales bacterium]